MTPPANAINLRRLVERAVALESPPSRTKGHLLGLGLSDRHSYTLDTGLKVPLPTFEGGLVHLRSAIAAATSFVNPDKAAEYLTGILSRPSVLIPLEVPSRATLMRDGIAIPEDLPLSKIRRIALVNVLHPKNESLQDGYLSEERIAGIANITVQLRRNGGNSADNAWLQLSWTRDTYDFMRVLADLWSAAQGSVRSRGTLARALMIVGEEQDAVVSDAAVAQLEATFGIVGLDLQVMRRTTTTYGDLENLVRRQSPRVLVGVGSNDAALSGLVKIHRDVGEATYGRLLEVNELDSILYSTRVILADYSKVSAGLFPVGLAPQTSRSQRPVMPVEQPGRCLHDSGERAYVEDRATQLWWTRDTAHHANSQFKTYRLSGDQLEHEACRAADGQPMVGKWKSTEGRVVKLSDLHSCKGDHPHL